MFCACVSKEKKTFLCLLSGFVYFPLCGQQVVLSSSVDGYVVEGGLLSVLEMSRTEMKKNKKNIKNRLDLCDSPLKMLSYSFTLLTLLASGKDRVEQATMANHFFLDHLIKGSDKNWWQTQQCNQTSSISSYFKQGRTNIPMEALSDSAPFEFFLCF